MLYLIAVFYLKFNRGMRIIIYYEHGELKEYASNYNLSIMQALLDGFKELKKQEASQMLERQTRRY